jgi:sugar/nucleoside kinase (ribokinase family)
LPYCDIIIGNESEAEAWAEANGVPDQKDMVAVAKKIASLPKANPSRPRIVVITQGPDSTVLVSSADVKAPKTFQVKALKAEEIVDTNGAGDAFAGGFLGAFVSGKTLDECVEVGHKLGGMCVGQVGSFTTCLHSPKAQHFHCRLVRNTSGRRSRFSRQINPLEPNRYISHVALNSDLPSASTFLHIKFCCPTGSHCPSDN